MRTFAIVLCLLSACAAPPSGADLERCTGKCDGPGETEGWISLAQLPADEQAQLRADLAQTPTEIDPTTWRLHRKDAGAFRIYWSAAAPGQTFDGPRPAMLTRLGEELVRARSRYAALGFALPAEIRVYVAEYDSASPQPNGTVSLGHHAIEIDLPGPLVAAWTPEDPQGAVSATPVHELFHIAQYFAYEQQHPSLPDWHPSNLWITEATAVYMEAALLPSTAWMTQYAPWGPSLPLFGLGCAGACKKEWYERVLFFRYLTAAGSLTDYHDLWRRLVVEADLTQPGAATAFLDRYLDGGLYAAWARFASIYETPALQRDWALPGIEALTLSSPPAEQRVAPGAGWSVDLWPVGGTRVALFSRDPDVAAALRLDTADPALAQVSALVWDGDGALVGTLAPGATLPLHHAASFSVTLTSAEPVHHTTATVTLVPSP